MSKSYFKTIFLAVLFVNLILPVYAAKTRVITPSTPVVSESLKPIVKDYRDGNYLQSLIKLQELVKKEPDNTYANYYLALTYTRLGKKEAAQKYYNIVVAQNTNMSLRYYSQKALACLEDPSAQECLSVKSVNMISRNTDNNEENKPKEDDDMDKFIKSGRKIHPAAADAITRERMERKLQADEYLRKQQESNEAEKQSSVPTKEEIIAAYDVLNRAGLNPYDINNSYNLAYNTDLMTKNNDEDLYSLLLNTDSKAAQMMILNQLTNNQNELLNYGI